VIPSPVRELMSRRRSGLRWAPLALVVLVVAPLAAAQARPAAGLDATASAVQPACTITGTEGDDLLGGTDFPDVICGLGGNDRLRGFGGNDILLGAAGNDTLHGGGGNDQLIGGPGTDTVIYPEVGLPGITVDLVAGTGGPTVDDGRDTDSIIDVENVTGTLGPDTLIGNGLANVLVGYPGVDTVVGGGGDDRFEHLCDAADNADSIDGGPGRDTVSYLSCWRGVTVDLEKGTATAPTGPGGATVTDTIRNVEDVVGSPFDDSLMGDGLANNLSGRKGNDVLGGRGGNDQLYADVGKDSLSGGDGNDKLFARDGTTDTLVDGGVGTDSARIDDGSVNPLVVDPVANVESLIP
jgi:Ca2+-binding RTX toxin-like protein